MPENPKCVYACTGNAIYKSTDAGVSFERVTEGLPTSGVGRIENGCYQSQPNVVYAVMITRAAAIKDYTNHQMLEPPGLLNQLKMRSIFSAMNLMNQEIP
jgi:hypothetical protein